MGRRRKIKVEKDLNDLQKNITLLLEDTREVLAAGVYDGAGIVADAYKDEILNIPIDNRWFVPEGKMKTGLSTRQRAGLYKGTGIAPFKYDDGGVNTKIGVDGYNTVETDWYPQGQPNSLVARGLVNGTYFLQRYDYVDKAKRRVSAECERAMSEKVKKEVKKRIKK